MIHIHTHPGSSNFLFDTSLQFNSPSIPCMSLGFSTLAVYSLALDNLKIVLFDFVNPQYYLLHKVSSICCIIVEFLRFLYSRLSGTRSNTQSFVETAHRLRCYSFPLSLPRYLCFLNIINIYLFHWEIGKSRFKKYQLSPNLGFNNFLLTRIVFKSSKFKSRKQVIPVLDSHNKKPWIIGRLGLCSEFTFFTSSGPQTQRSVKTIYI